MCCDCKTEYLNPFAEAVTTSLFFCLKHQNWNKGVKWTSFFSECTLILLGIAVSSHRVHYFYLAFKEEDYLWLLNQILSLEAATHFNQTWKVCVLQHATPSGFIELFCFSDFLCTNWILFCIALCVLFRFAFEFNDLGKLLRRVSNYYILVTHQLTPSNPGLSKHALSLGASTTCFGLYISFKVDDYYQNKRTS